MKLVILITAQLEGGLDAAQRWNDVGAPGVTIIRSHGLESLRRHVEHGHIELPRMVLSMAGAMAAIIESMEQTTTIVLSVVEAALVDALITAATDTLGSLDAPDTGIVFVLDVERAFGVTDHRRR